MINRAITAGVPLSWFTADEVYGQAKWLQAWLEDQDVAYYVTAANGGNRVAIRAMVLPASGPTFGISHSQTVRGRRFSRRAQTQ
jgi:hypothetical protein